MARRSYIGRTEIEKDFLKVFNALCYRHNPWTVWQAFTNTTACAIANAVDREPETWKRREESYLASIKGWDREEVEKLAELFALTARALEENPAQDFLGTLYMNLDFGSGWSGQFFTPYHVSEAMVLMTMGDNLVEQIEKEGYVSVNDPCCGAGCMLIAFAQACKARKINYQQGVLFVAQDLDKVVAQMCYIQLSLLGCAGYVIVGNTLTHPAQGAALFPVVDPECELWYMPMWYSDVWVTRCALARMRALWEACGKPGQAAQQN